MYKKFKNYLQILYIQWNKIFQIKYFLIRPLITFNLLYIVNNKVNSLKVGFVFGDFLFMHFCDNKIKDIEDRFM